MKFQNFLIFMQVYFHGGKKEKGYKQFLPYVINGVWYYFQLPDEVRGSSRNRFSSTSSSLTSSLSPPYALRSMEAFYVLCRHCITNSSIAQHVLAYLALLSIVQHCLALPSISQYCSILRSIAHDQPLLGAKTEQLVKNLCNTFQLLS